MRRCFRGRGWITKKFSLYILRLTIDRNLTFVIWPDWRTSFACTWERNWWLTWFTTPLPDFRSWGTSLKTTTMPEPTTRTPSKSSSAHQKFSPQWPWPSWWRRGGSSTPTGWSTYGRSLERHRYAQRHNLLTFGNDFVGNLLCQRNKVHWRKGSLISYPWKSMISCNWSRKIEQKNLSPWSYLLFSPAQ